MSHIVDIKTRLEDLEAVKAACAELSKKLGIAVTFKEGQTRYAWYGHSVGDYPLPEGFKKKDLGKCDHAITIEGAGYEIGLARAKGGKPGYIMLFDFWGPGDRLLDILCSEQQAKELRSGATKACTAGRFMQTYALNKAELAAKKLGYNTARQTLKNGAVNVLVRGRF